MMSMLRTFADRGDRRPSVLFYANRHFEDAMFGDELEELKQKLALDVVHVVSQPPDGWQGERGRIDAELLQRHLPAGHQRMQCFICGPEPFQDAMVVALRSLGVPGGRIHTERFNWVLGERVRHNYVTWAAFAVSVIILVARVVFGLGQGG
jgi:ferredoxin-NADP reductase